MNQPMAVLFLWILVPALVLALAVAWYAVQSARGQQARIDALTWEQRAREDAVEHLAATTLPSVTESIRRPGTLVSAVEVPAGMEQSRFAQCLQQIAERHAHGLTLLQSETREVTRREADDEAQRAIKLAEDAARDEVGASAREATSAAVRSFGTSVVSLGADVSQVVSTALREHRGDDVYETLTRIDHTVQQMIRQAQSYVIVCGGLPGRRWPPQLLTDLVGGATGRVRDYLRVRTNQLDRVVMSRAVEPLVHTLATLLDNALRYSPPTSYVDVSFQEGHHGVTVIIDDAGVRMNSEQMEDSRQVLANERPVDIHQLGPTPKVGFPGVAALARRYGFTVYIDGPNAYGGMRAMVYIPEALLVAPQAGSDDNIAAATANVSGKPSPVAAVGERAGPGEQHEGGQHSAESSAVHDITSSGLPRRRRRNMPGSSLDEQQYSSTPEPELARPDIAAAWQSGTKSGRAAGSDHVEGMTS